MAFASSSLASRRSGESAVRAAPSKARGKGSGGSDKDAITACVAEMSQSGWTVEPFTERGGFSPTKSVSRNPTLVQLTEQHAVATVEDDDGKWVFHSNEEHALPLTHYANRLYRMTGLTLLTSLLA